MNLDVLADPTDTDWTSSGAWNPIDEATADPYLRLWTCAGTSSACSFNEDLPRRVFVFVAGTHAGLEIPTEPEPLQTALGEIRQRSHLTWDQLALVFGVNRRSLHFWARGARPSADNAERIGRVLEIVRRVDVGEPTLTRQLLLEPSVGGASIVGLLGERRDDAVFELIEQQAVAPGSSRHARRRRPPALSTSARANRRAFTPAELLDARHDDTPALGEPMGSFPVPGLRV